MDRIYERSFDLNEWFIIISLFALLLLIWITPKIFSFLEGLSYYIYGISIGMFYDHTISIPPWDFYDVNDSSAYQAIDFISYIMYGPYSYFFIYIYKKLKIRGIMNLAYLLIWTAFSILVEWFTVRIGIFHFDKGYAMYWSIPIYMAVQSIQLLFHHKINKSA
ncbi:hypothetical protein [Rossellomorea aquimaris]|uniref:Uncharacterized protein n=1 Tax=Rossellomorea aquimaris TaxID=189382 RepID=A0A5D4TKB2_9BACI|nr:hypothetical protein [Rossellomorea aquimaris]TYS75211.1 hypothetical protein FZD05_21355 [Rossellomorea aquimaris]TYS79588.1 hypothetical protein FZC85_21275 [Rossellomorea aquimaris]